MESPFLSKISFSNNKKQKSQPKLTPMPQNVKFLLRETNLLFNGLPACIKSRVQNLFTVRERYKQTRFCVPSSTQLVQNLVPFCNIGFSVAIDKYNSTIIGAEVTNAVNNETVEKGGIDDRIIAILKVETLYFDASRRHLKAILQGFFADSANVMFITVRNTIINEVLEMRLMSLFEERVPLRLLRLGIIPIAKRNVETFLTETSRMKGTHRDTSVRNYEDLIIGYKADR